MLMDKLLSRLEKSLERCCVKAEFRLEDNERAGDFEWLEYRRVDASGVRLLGVFDATHMRTITAELWRPSQLTDTAQAPTKHAGIVHQQSWDYGCGADPQQVEREIVEAVSGWLRQRTSRTARSH